MTELLFQVLQLCVKLSLFSIEVLHDILDRRTTAVFMIVSTGVHCCLGDSSFSLLSTTVLTQRSCMMRILYGVTRSRSGTSSGRQRSVLLLVDMLDDAEVFHRLRDELLIKWCRATWLRVILEDIYRLWCAASTALSQLPLVEVALKVTLDNWWDLTCCLGELALEKVVTIDNW